MLGAVRKAGSSGVESALAAEQAKSPGPELILSGASAPRTGVRISSRYTLRAGGGEEGDETGRARPATSGGRVVVTPHSALSGGVGAARAARDAHGPR
jgi:hypothetical protein